MQMLEPIRYEADGAVMTGMLADGSRGERAPAVLIGHEATGIGAHVEEVARRLAERGYVAFACDLLGGRDLPMEEARARNRDLMTRPGALIARARAALQVIEDHPSVDPRRMATIGFCQGGIMALELARAGAPILAAIAIHPGFMRPAGSTTDAIASKVLVITGAGDPIVSQEDRMLFAEEMTAAGADWQLHLYGAVGHSFTNPAVDAFGLPGFAFDQRASDRAWASTLALLDEIF